jgi:hypothetical protein
MYNWDKINCWLAFGITIALILVFFFKKPTDNPMEYYRYRRQETCKDLQAQYCRMMKNGTVDALQNGPGVSELLYKIKRKLW